MFPLNWINDTLDPPLLYIGENTLLVSLFWADSHFDSYFNFATIPVSKNRKINFILVFAVNLLTENSYMADEMSCSLTWQ